MTDKSSTDIKDGENANPLNFYPDGGHPRIIYRRALELVYMTNVSHILRKEMSN